MKCNQSKEILLRYDLDAEDRAALLEALQHVQSCPECRESVTDFDDLCSAIASERQDRIPNGGWDEFHNRLAAAIPTKRSGAPKGAFGNLWLMAACLLVAFGLGVLVNNTKQPSQTGPSQKIAPSKTEHLTLTRSDIENQTGTFQELDNVYEGKAGWVLTSDSGADIGLAGREETGKGLLLMRLRLSKGGSELALADLAIVPGQVADISLPLKNGSRLQCNVSSSNSGTQASVYAELITGSNRSINLGALAAWLNGNPEDTGTMSTSVKSYRLEAIFSRSVLQNRKKQS